MADKTQRKLEKNEYGMSTKDVDVKISDSIRPSGRVQEGIMRKNTSSLSQELTNVKYQAYNSFAKAKSKQYELSSDEEGFDAESDSSDQKAKELLQMLELRHKQDQAKVSQLVI